MKILVKKTSVLLLLVATLSAMSQSLNDARRLTNNEQYDLAETEFNKLLQAQPNSGDYLFYFGENYFQNDNLDKAKATYQKAIELNPTNPLGYVGLGKIQWSQKQNNDANANFFKATTLAKTFKYETAGTTINVNVQIGKNTSVAKAKYVNNSEATVLSKIAEAYIVFENKNVVEAQLLLTQALKLEPYNPEIYILTGDAYLEENNGSKAIEYYEKAATLDDKSVKAILRQGQLYNRSRNYNLALDFYKKASLIDSSFAPAYREKAEIYFRAGQYNNASAQYKRYLQLNNDCGARSRYAGFLNQAKQYKESIEAAKEALKCNPDNAYTYRYKGRSEMEVGDFANGLESMSKFFELALKNPEMKIIPEDYEYRAKSYSKTAKDSLAIAEYKKAIELQPDKLDLNAEIGACYIKMKKYADAIDSYNKKIKGGKPNVNDYFGIGRAYYYNKDFVNADSSFAKIAAEKPDYYLGYFWRAKAAVQQDLVNKSENFSAKPQYEMYIAKVKPEELERNKKDLAEAHTYLAAYYAKQKDCLQTTENFKKVLEYDPANAQAKKFLATPCK
jgi:tetratricopeptide (TPR) repeat protein